MTDKPNYREIRYREKRQKILDCAARLFSRKGYEKASVEEIAAELNLNKASLYYYIKSKNEILYYIQEQAIAQANEALEKILELDMNPVEKLEAAIKSHVRIITRCHIMNILKDHEFVLSRKSRKKLVSRRDAFERNFNRIVQDGVESGAFDCLNWKMSAKAALSAINRIPAWYSPRGELSPDEIGEAMVDFILKGFGYHLPTERRP